MMTEEYHVKLVFRTKRGLTQEQGMEMLETGAHRFGRIRARTYAYEALVLSSDGDAIGVAKYAARTVRGIARKVTFIEISVR
jgi:hypothetical protein